MALAVKSPGLGGLKKAMYILQCLDRGQTRKQIVEALNGDEKLLYVWIFFLMQYDWIEQQNDLDEWLITPKGREWLEELNSTLTEG